MDMVFLKMQKTFFFRCINLVFISTNKYVELFSCTQGVYAWKSKEMKEESIKNPPGSNIIWFQIWLIIIHYQLQILLKVV